MTISEINESGCAIHQLEMAAFVCTPITFTWHSSSLTPHKYAESTRLYYCCLAAPSQQTRDVQAMLAQCWASVADGGPTLSQHCWNVSCLLVQTCSSLITQECWFNEGPIAQDVDPTMNPYPTLTYLLSRKTTSPSLRIPLVFINVFLFIIINRETKFFHK